MKLIECPRDAMQGLEDFVPTDKKIAYLNQLLKVGFETLDFGSFVSPKAIPQMRDTPEVLQQLDVSESATKLLAIVANTRGAEDASRFEKITYLGFPLSLSETFQQRNTNKSIGEALETVNVMQDLCTRRGKILVTYISMGFGNPYKDPYDEEIVARFVDILATLGIRVVSLADTIGVSNPGSIRYLFSTLKVQFPQIEFGVHLHSQTQTAREKIEAAYEAGCRRFDGALRGYGGCPMAADELVGNLATETILEFLDSKGDAPVLDRLALNKAMQMADELFPH